MDNTILRFRHTMGNFATGVTVVCTVHEQQPYGLTVNSFTSVSLDPMLILICISRHAASHEAIRARGRFTVSILTEEQSMISTVFAGAPVGDRFKSTACDVAPSGLPIVRGAMAWLDAEVVELYDGGDHGIFLARIDAMDIPLPSAKPLLYFRGSYGRMADDE